MTMTTKPRSRFVPRAEALEARVCMDTSVVNILLTGGHTLQITGTRRADRVSVEMGRDGKVMASANGGAAQTFTGIDHLRASTGDGPDQVSIMILGGRLADVSVDLGKGADRLDARFDFAPLSATFQGGDGKDRMNVAYGGGGGGEVSFNPQPEPPGSPAGIIILGGKSRDTINFKVQGHFNDDLTANIDGGSDGDTIDALFAPAAHNMGRIHGSVLGGKGNDRLSLNHSTLDNPTYFDVALDGGSGRGDKANVGPGINVRGIEKATQVGIWVQ
jgi:hypothetical protein